MGRPADPVAAATHPDPYPYYRELVAERPLYRDDALRMWIASSAVTVTAALTSPLCRVRPPAEPVPHALVGSAVGEVFGQLVRMTDGPRHLSAKPTVSHALASFDGRRVADEAQRWAQHLVGELRPATDSARIADVAFRLPVYVVASLLGAAADALPHTAAAVHDFVRCLAPGAAADDVRRGAVAANDLLETIGRGRDVMAANRVGFLSQAYEATAGLIGNTLVALARHSDVDRTTLAPVIREVVRHDAPVQNTRRFVGSDGEVGGQPMKAGDTILVLLAAANHDAAENPAPERFDPRRRERRAFTFGAGMHACPGEMLASAIAEAGVRALLAGGVEPSRLLETLTYRASVNTRVPLFT